jgi:hypothetical protein
MTKHYINIDENNNIIRAFSDKFEQPDQDSICVCEDGCLHFNLVLQTIDGYYRYKWENSEIVEKDPATEIYTSTVLTEIENKNNLLQLAMTECDMSNVTEDLINLLHSGGMIDKANLSQDSQDTLATREALK